MENTERQKFDDAWRDAFQQAEQSPSAEVWSSLDRELTRAEGGTMKRRVIFYQRLAAASILFALALGGLATYYATEQTTDQKNQLATSRSSVGTFDKNAKDQTPIPERSSVNKNNTNISDEGLNENSPVLIENSSASNQPGLSGLIAQGPDDTQPEGGVLDEEQRGNEQLNLYQRKYGSVSISDIPSPEVNVSSKVRDVTIVRKLPAMPASYMADSRKAKKSKEDLWASIGASAGSYSPQISTSSFAMASASPGSAFSNANSNSSSTGSAYSVGVNMGKKIAERWILQGGITYLNQAIGYNSNFAAIDPNNQAKAFVADYALQQNSTSLTLTSPYEINSVNEFVSIPLQAGYLLVDRKVGLLLNSGMATDIFLQNTLTDVSGQLDKYTEGAGEDSPYRTVSWSALMGTEVSYKVGTQYRIALVPGLRYSVSSVLKSESVSGNPLVWDIGFRFRYIFK